MEQKNFEQEEENLIALMQKEIALMREVLANMHEEEISLRMNDKHVWTKVLCQRAEILRLLSPLREKRIEASKGFKKEVEMDHFEILTMRDQLMALIEKMNQQNATNESLYKGSERAPQLQKIPEAKKKSSIATYDGYE